MTQYEQEEAGKLKLDTLLALGAACEARSPKRSTPGGAAN